MKLISDTQKVKEKKRFRVTQLPKFVPEQFVTHQFQVRKAQNLRFNIFGSEDKLCKPICMNTIQKPASASLNKLQKKRCVIRRSSTPNCQPIYNHDQLSTLMTQPFKTEKPINQRAKNKKQLLKSSFDQFPKYNSQNLLQLSNKNKQQYKKQKKINRCKLLLQKYNKFPFFNKSKQQQNQRAIRKSKQKQNAYITKQKQKSSQLFNLNISCIEQLNNLDSIDFITKKSYKQNPIF